MRGLVALGPVRLRLRLPALLPVLLPVLLLAACIPAHDRAAPPPPPPPLEPVQPVWLEPDPAPVQALPPRASRPPVVTPRAHSVAATSHIVQPGETLGGIAGRTGAGVAAIAAANHLAPPYVLRTGQRLVIPGGRYHQVAAGETGIAIARAYGVSWSQMVVANGLDAPYVLRTGQRLRLPDDPATAPADRKADSRKAEGRPSLASAPDGRTLEERAAAFDIGIDDILTGSQPALPKKDAAPRKAIPAPPTNGAAQNAAAAFQGRFAWPVSGPILSGFGAKGGGRVNDGIDIGATHGVPVRAAAPGVIAYAGHEIAVYGGLVLINHGDGWVTAYGHMDGIKVARGAKVTAGQAIGVVGAAGYGGQPQLHFEIRRDRKPVDPLSRLPAR